ncbi:class I SAM-dependent methyltransferase [Thioclava sp. GXIMD2076]|uniref:class I SAM-dependent methyltransferase n=1 Tax=Thioclava sp. GXIMD2076 TaxID=3131931 RepID=UPI0030D14FDA
MTHPRLSLALEQAPLPETGTILVLGALADTDLSDLPKDRLELVQGFAPDHAGLSARGYTVSPAPQSTGYAAAVLFLPRAKQEARNALARLCALVAEGGMILVDGAKNDGVDSVLKSLKPLVSPSSAIAKAHGKVFRFAARRDVLDEWVVQAQTPTEGFVTTPGVFSADKVDAGSALLAQALPGRLPARMADLGAGWGWLSAQILAREGVETLDLVEADFAALDCAKQNITDQRASFHWEDVTGFEPAARYSGIVMNPPFHVGHAGDPNLGQAFIRKAASILSLSGKLWMVANRHLPYEDTLRQVFHHVEEIGGNTQFKLFFAEKPLSKSQVAKAAPTQTKRGR